MIHGHEIDPPDDLPCLDCHHEEHRPKPEDMLGIVLNAIEDFPDGWHKRYIVAAKETAWFRGFAAWLESAYDETVRREEWGTCASHAAAREGE